MGDVDKIGINMKTPRTDKLRRKIKGQHLFFGEKAFQKMLRHARELERELILLRGNLSFYGEISNDGK